MSHNLNSEAIAALVYLILYSILFTILITGYITGRLKFRSRYTILLFHVTVRLASQATGLAFGIIGYANIDLLVAYFILSAEGYFTLVLCTFCFLISWQYRNSAEHSSWLEPRHPKGTSLFIRLLESFTLFGPKRHPMSVVHNLLAAANAIIIAGGSLLAGGYQDPEQLRVQLKKAKGMRTAGQSIFLSITIFLLYCIVRAIRTHQRETKPRSTVHPTLWVLLAVWPLLFVRGLYGVLSALLPSFNYFNLDNYSEAGLTEGFVVDEYVLGTTMEWASCALLMLTYYTSRCDPKKTEWDEAGKEGGVVEA